jgi:RNA polymerase sigma factor (sigma-70 family)
LSKPRDPAPVKPPERSTSSKASSELTAKLTFPCYAVGTAPEIPKKHRAIIDLGSIEYRHDEKKKKSRLYNKRGDWLVYTCSMEAVLVQRLEKVYRSERTSLLGFIRSRTGSLEEAEDLLQDVFFQAIRAASVTEPIENVVGWLYTIARNKIIDRYRRRRNDLSLQQEREDITLEELLADSGINIEKEFIRRAVMDALIEALEELPPEQRDAFIQQAIEGKTFREISEQSGVPLNTLIARKRYAVQFLRKRLHDLKEMVDELA